MFKPSAYQYTEVMNMSKKRTFVLHVLQKMILLLLVFGMLRSGNVMNASALGKTSDKYCAVSVKHPDVALTQNDQNQNKFGGEGISSVAFDFHVFANQVVLNAHTNGNIATNYLDAGGQGIGTERENYLGKREDNYIGVEVKGLSNIASKGYLVVGTGIPIVAEEFENKLKIGNASNALDSGTSDRAYQEQDDSITYIDVQKELANLQQISKELATYKTTPGVTLGNVTNENQKITVQKTGNQILNVTADQISSNTTKRVLDIVLPENTTLIINVDMANQSQTQLSRLVTRINGAGNSEGIIRSACGVLWNLYDSNAKHTSKARNHIDGISQALRRQRFLF